jgi:hypothetical protein
MSERYILDLREEPILHFDVRRQRRLPWTPSHISVEVRPEGGGDSLTLRLAEGQAEALLILLEREVGRKE